MSSRMSGPGLYEFLIEAELQQYYNTLKNELKVQNTSQLKYVTDEDLAQIGMSRPEIRRLKKYFQKHFPSNVLAKMKKLLSRSDNPISISSLTSGSSSSLGRYSRNVAPGRHIIQADSIVIHKTLGSGEFGTVQQGVWTDHDNQRIQVAIKCLSQERMENNPVEFLKEAAIMHAVDHEHVVRLYGVVLDTSALMLVTELAPLRSLLECLKEPSMRTNLGVPALYDFAIQICTGMEYLESKRLIHRDLAARNILVFSRSKVKISDFGLSRALGVGKDYYQTNFNVNLKLPIAWCAPECINFLRFTSASDVFAFGVTLWEMFSYGFQPWAALTGQQILEAIDEPNYQRLEKPECCPHDIYYQIMLKCWQHDTATRPSFADLSNALLPECKPEQVQAIRGSEMRGRREYLEYEAGDIISVLEKKTSQGSDEGHLWKGVLKDGRSGVFNPANTITYLGSSFPTVKKSPFTRNDSRSSSLRSKGRISADMISGPQGDFKHTGHVGPDGQFFGDITFLGNKSWVPRQVVSPYKPELSGSETASDFTTPIARLPQCSSSKTMQEINDVSSDTAPLLSAAQMNMDGNDHEYHEISDEENELRGGRREDLGHSNPALSSKSQSPLDSPRFEKSFDLGGPSLIDEVFGALQHQDEAHNVKNELREMARTKKKFATVKPISSSDRKTLDHAIHLANELASRSMLDLDKPGKSGNSLDDISSPRTPTSPSHKRKFSFILGGRNERERRNFSQEANSIPDIQSTLTDEAKEAYNSLIEKPSVGALGFLTPSFENKSTSFNYPEKSSCSSKHSEFFELEPSQKGSLPSSDVFPSCSSNVNNTSSGIIRKTKPRNLSLPDERMVMNYCEQRDREIEKAAAVVEEEIDGNPLRLLRQNKASNVLPLPPRDRNKSSSVSSGGGGVPFIASRHQRKHPLLIPSKISISSSTVEAPPPPPKPQRQYFRLQPNESSTTTNNDGLPSVEDCEEKSSLSTSQSSQVEKSTPLEQIIPPTNLLNNDNNSASKTEQEGSRVSVKEGKNSVFSVIESLRNRQSAAKGSNFTKEKIRLYENFESVDIDVGNSNFNGESQSQPTNVETEPTSDNFPTVSSTNLHKRVASLDLSPTSTSISSAEPLQSQNIVDPIKIRTVRRILGTSATEEECRWAVEITDDAAHGVKLLRLKSLLPDSIMNGDIDKVVSVLEMSHWDVARAAAFLLDSDKKKSKSISKLKCTRTEITTRRRSEFSLANNINNQVFNSTDESNNNTHTNGTSSTSTDDERQEFIRPTRV